VEYALHSTGQATIGQKNAALRAPYLHLKAISANHSWTEVPLAEGDDIFPWPSSPGQGNNTILCGLRVSVVNSRSKGASLPRNLRIDRLGNRGWNVQLLSEPDDGAAEEVALILFAFGLDTPLIRGFGLRGKIVACLE
jgi:hypothetical protein